MNKMNMKQALGVMTAVLSSAAFAYTLDENFEIVDADRGSPSIEIERTSSLSHGHGAILDGAYHILLTGNRHFLAAPPSRDFTLELDYDLKLHHMEFGLGFDIFFRRDRVKGDGHLLRIWWNEQSNLRFQLDGRDILKRDDGKLPALTGHKLRLRVAGTRGEVETLGERVAFDLPVDEPAGKIAFDMPYSSSNMLVLHRVKLVTDDEPAFTPGRTLTFELRQTQGFVAPAVYTVRTGRYATGETRLDVSLGGMLPGRPPRQESGGSEWGMMLERLTDPYVRIDGADGSARVLKLWQGRRQFGDAEVKRRADPRAGEAKLVVPDWPVTRRYCLSTLPESFTVAAGYEKAMANPWRFAANGPYEQIRRQDGAFLHEGEAIRPGRIAFRATSPVDKAVVRRIPADIPDRDRALRHAREQPHFVESETIRFTLEGVCRAADFDADEVVFRPRFEDVYGDDLKAPDFTLGEKRVEKLSAGLLRVTQEATLAKNPGVGIWRLVTDVGFGVDRRLEKTEFEVLGDVPGGIPPPEASGLPFLVSMPNEIKFLEEGAFDPWSDRAGVGLYYSAEAYYPRPGLRKHVADLLHVYDRKWWAQNNCRNFDDNDPKSALNREVIAKADFVQCFESRTHGCSYDFSNRCYYKPDINPRQIRLLQEYAALKKPPFKVLTKETLDGLMTRKDETGDGGLTQAEKQDLFYTCWDDFCDWARACVDDEQDAFLEYLRSVNPKVGRGHYGPRSIYTSTYKTPYSIRTFSFPLERKADARRNGSFWVFEDYHFSCDYPVYRGSFFVQGMELFYPDTRRIFPEIYYSGWGRCNDGAVFQAHPGASPFLDFEHQRRVVYSYTFGTPHLKDGRYGYWTGLGFHARNPEREAMDQFIHAWGKYVKNRPARPLKAPYSIVDFGAFRRRGDYLETDADFFISIGDQHYDFGGDICNSAEEAIAWSYENCVASGYNTPVVTTLADLDSLTRENAEFVMLPALVPGTPKEILNAVRRLHARGVNLLCFEACAGLEDLFGVKAAPARPLREIGGEAFTHKMANVPYAPDGATVLVAGAETPGGAADVPLLVGRETPTGRTAFFTLPPTVVRRAMFTGRYLQGQPVIGKAMPAAARKAFAFLSSSAPAVRTEHGTITAVETVNGDLAVIVSDDTPNYGAPPAFPLSFRFTVSAPGIERLHVTADAPFAVVRRERDRVTLRTETTRDNALFFKFAKE